MNTTETLQEKEWRDASHPELVRIVDNQRKELALLNRVHGPKVPKHHMHRLVRTCEQLLDGEFDTTKVTLLRLSLKQVSAWLAHQEMKKSIKGSEE